MSSNEVSGKISSDETQLQRTLIEARHQVKNSFQNIISYINVLFVGKNVVDSGSFNKLIRYIRVVSSLNDLVLKTMEKKGTAPVVPLDDVLHEVINANNRKDTITTSSFPSMNGTPRFAATLALVFHELLEYAAFYGEKKLEIDIKSITEGKAQIVVRSIRTLPTSANAPEEFIGLPLIELLARNEFDSPVDRFQEGDISVIRCTFPYEHRGLSINDSL